MKSVKTFLILTVFCLFGFIFSACAGEQTQAEPVIEQTSEPIPATASEAAPISATATPFNLEMLDYEEQHPRVYNFVLSADEISGPDITRPGLAIIKVENADSKWHAAIFRRMNDDVSLADFDAAFQQDPFSTMPLTFAIGGPDVPGGSSVEGLYFLDVGTYIVVDNWVEPPRYTTFMVEGEMISASAPPENVNVKMDEYTLDMPESVPGGSNLWLFFNKGEYIHNVGIVKLTEGNSIDDIIAWMGDRQSQPPMEQIAFWNVMSPGATSRVVINLPPGEYVALDFLPDANNQEGFNMQQGMWQEFIVTP